MDSPPSPVNRRAMRLGTLAFAAALIAAAPAWAQSTLTLEANPVPIVDAQINGRPVRLEVDLTFPRGLALSTQAAERIGVRRVPFVGVRIALEGSDASIGGRVARPRITFRGTADDESTRAFSGVFAVPVSTRADGVIGPGVLPYDVVVVRLRPDQDGARDIAFSLSDEDEWVTRTQVGGQSVLVNFNPGVEGSIFNRTAARVFDASGGIQAAGALAEMPVALGLRTLMQPVTSALDVSGIPIGPSFARTNAPLLGADEADAVVVEAEPRDPPPARITLGRAALSNCSTITVERRTRRLTLRCAL